ncbi:MAG: Rieske 2Fe-2S domain-containing protein [Actinobacteria bacterium]|nr:Rieske 2Fe-2S domain-containing protein [Actinomycetota bacterium]
MNPTATSPASRSGLIALCEAADVPFGEGRSVTLHGRRIAIFNTAAGFFAIDNDCPHQGGPLSDGLLADACVTCPLHGRRVDLRSGRVQGHDESVRTYELYLLEGSLWLNFDAMEPLAA